MSPEVIPTNDTANPGDGAPSAAKLTNAEIEYYYRGFLTVLRRYRSLALVGWAVVAVGFGILVIGWRTETHLVEIILASLTMMSGIIVVHFGVTVLDTYVRIPVRELQGAPTEPLEPPLNEILELMNDVASGGWQEAFGALNRLRAIAKTHGLPDG